MTRVKVIGLCIIVLAVLPAALAFAEENGTPADSIIVLKEEVRELRKQMDLLQRANKTKVETREKFDTLSERTTVNIDRSTEDALEAEIEEFAAGGHPAAPYQGVSLGSTLQSFNPDISVIIDTFYHNNDSPEGIDEIFEDMAGFGHVHGHDHGHEHARLDDGFNLRHLELYFAGEVDPYFKAYAIAAVSEEDAELEEAVIETTCLPLGLQVQAGKFFSDFGRINAQHSHEWDFADQPIIHKLTLGDHGLNEKGVQLSWMAPTRFYLLAGVEAFQGENELLFNHIGGENLPDREGPRLWTGWIKFSPNLPQKHGMQAGLSGIRGVHHEAHDGNDDGTEDHWLKGHGKFLGADLVYKYDSRRNYGHGDFTAQGEYFYRTKDLSVHRHALLPEFTGQDRIDKQDGYYLQTVYGFSLAGALDSGGNRSG